MDDCPICLKHLGRGPHHGHLVGRWDGFWVYHAPPGNDGLASLGYLFVESDRHAPYLADLTEEEAAALGRLRTRLARALRGLLDAEFVHAAVSGMGIAHFHEHVFTRHRGTPPEVKWFDSDEAAPRADEARVADLVARIARAVDAASGARTRSSSSRCTARAPRGPCPGRRSRTACSRRTAS